MKKLRFSGRLIKAYTWQNKDFVQHPGAAVIVPFVNKYKVIMVRQPRFAIKQMTWEVPAGTLGKNENPLVCAKRELEEETGLKAGKIKKILAFYSSPGFLHEKMHLYKATNLKAGKMNLDEDEDITVKIFTKSQLMKMIRKGKIVDAKTIAALLLTL
ncbi:MAG: NUDIX hydrolase [Candidatus Firestonebacteria bacterium]